MRKFNIKQQIGKLYLVTFVGHFQIAGKRKIASTCSKSSDVR